MQPRACTLVRTSALICADESQSQKRGAEQQAYHLRRAFGGAMRLKGGSGAAAWSDSPAVTLCPAPQSLQGLHAREQRVAMLVSIRHESTFLLCAHARGIAT
jgi:hypothetical protein